MTGILAGLDWLSTVVETTELRLLVTVGAVGLLLAALLGHRRLNAWVGGRTRPVYGDIVAVTTLVGSCIVAFAVAVGVWGLTETIYSVYADDLELGEDVVARAVVSFVLVITTVIFTRLLWRLFEELLGSASAVTDHQREITRRMTQVVVWSLSLVVILGIWVDDLGGLLVGAGFLGIVLGMAARQTLGTILAGFVLMFSRPFEIGDWIELEGNQGVVTDISIVNTRIQTFDGEYVVIPNDVISSSMVTNRSKRGRLRVEIDVGVDYETDLERASELAEAVVADLEYAISGPSPQVVTRAFGESAVILGVRFWIDNPSARRRWEARTAAINAIKREFEAAGITIPFPQQELSSRDGTGVSLAGGDTATDRGPGDQRYDDSRGRRVNRREEVGSDSSFESEYGPSPSTDDS
ncbi:mechanosensitive ion channel family protein [Natrarchaeobaculum aegyptiacum]|uniref:mechanosensitive ion channel family protein n=1 Tax=Natrarchaeobaculum aegyptiacum TaxID=745377 RepID=UPI000A3D8556|nr:mechanosensitive ion channel family protein [Natrarchaeobaculum aegyptiacum]